MLLAGPFDYATSGPLLGAVAVAVLAGLASFLSPCILPLVPGYLSYVTGLAGADLDSGHRRGRVVAGISLFIAGFTAVFVTLIVLATSAAMQLMVHRRTVEIVAGAIVIVLGLAFMGLVPGLERQWRVQKLPAAGLIGAPVFGVVFALSWAPCTGPTLAAMIALGSTSGSQARAVTLAVAYSLGIGLPFIAVGLGFQRLIGVIKFIRRNSRWVTRIGGALLVLVGLALVTGVWSDLMIALTTNVGPGSVPI
ncbi:cytochrome c biogenesis protein CcdA [Dactylosporangium sp. NBC_01737]|uniref:cytochrome c biogenesis CcdA family protein n=1 Tax=Dactylosporangium sp. NBC_01737 TaxID=2975959 RepID=UPI002E10C25E|nr:cytochrome c biogenesis protein CcdA [Dactylosporangium sp. NBC_01737]